MGMRLSKLYGMDIFTDSGRFLGKVHEIVLDLEKGSVLRLLLEPIGGSSKDDVTKQLKEKSVLYKSVKSVEDVVVVSKPASAGLE